MDHFSYQNGEMFAENVSLKTIAREVGTPVYVYSTATLVRHFKVFSEAFSGLDALVCFAVKANSNQAVLATLAAEGAGADVVSEGELIRALRAGIPADKIVFSGVGKKAGEMAAALKAGIKQFNVESEPELEVLNSVAEKMGLIAPVSVRVNPDVDAKTHHKIATGKSENKFGIAWSKAEDVYARIAQLPGLRATGVDVHIGSQLTDLGPFKAAFEKVLGLVKRLRASGHTIDHIDLGGGLGIPYDPAEESPPSPGLYGAMIKEVLGDMDCSIILEPGRLIAGNAGILLSELLYVKQGEDRIFYIVDAAMNDLLRPAMYDAFHAIQPVDEPQSDHTIAADFVGPVCESGDTFATGRQTPELEPGDLVTVKSAGAYGAVLSSTYNTRELVPEVLVNDDKYAVVRARPSIDDLIGLDKLPDWLTR